MKTLMTIALVVLATGPFRAETSTQTYHATFDYDYANPVGVVTRRERVSGTYTRNLHDQTATWIDVGVASAEGLADFGPASPQAFMKGFRYPLKAPNMTTDAFFGGIIPPTALQERNLVWDTHMFESFGEEQWAHLVPNTPYHYHEETEVPLAGAGTFTNHDVQLRLTGTTVRNRQRCTVIDYVALFNRAQITMPGFTLNGRSDYWGQVWVVTASKQLEAATLYEEVVGQVTEGAAPAAPVNVFRAGTLERVRTR